MEDTGVGRPSTYATILETLKLRKYIVEYKKNIGPSQLGLKVDSYLFLNFFDLIGESFTKDLESKLDQITDEKASRVKLVANFYDQLKQILKSPRKKMVSIGKENQSKVKYDTDEKQTLSEKVKNGKGSEKKGNTKNQNQSLTYIENKTCPKCLDGYVKTKLGKNGKTIYFCSRYPHCDYITYDN
uniref:TopA-like protein n=2 Tax=Leptospira biflexa TaxID=172 RepID=Q8GCV1_LEPBI|nr:topA-like protein [Leptospira biflexa serovar Patoc strain 'Patoc 1 (Paris)']